MFFTISPPFGNQIVSRCYYTQFFVFRQFHCGHLPATCDIAEIKDKFYNDSVFYNIAFVFMKTLFGQRYFYLLLGFLTLLWSAPRRFLAEELNFNPPGYNDLGGDLGLPGDQNTDLVDMTINFIKWALGFLGLVAVIFITIGGYMYMTSGGNEEKVEKAKQYLKNALIGLIIVLLSWAIAYFTFNTILNEATRT